MTPLQQKMIVKIATNEMNTANGNPQNAEETETWADCVIENAEDKGVFVSLVNAGLVYHDGLKKRDAGVGLTDAGFAEYTKIKDKPVVQSESGDIMRMKP